MRPTFTSRSRAVASLVFVTLLPGAGLTAVRGQAAADGTPRAERLLAETRPLVIAHRGYSAFAPENTLPAFDLGKRAGADLVELDYFHTKDGVPVVLHDPTLDRTTDAVEKLGARGIRVDARTAAELRSLDAGRWFGDAYAGTRLPTLIEALENIQRDGGVTLIERKAGDAATVARLLTARRLINDVIVQSFDWAYLRDLHAALPGQILGALGPPATRDGRTLSTEEKALTPAWVDDAAATGARVVVWNRQITPAAVDHAHARGLKVWAYTIDDPIQAAALLDLGIDGIITNNPSLIWRTVALRTRR